MCCAGAPGTTTTTTVGRQIATGTIPTTGTTITVFVLPKSYINTAARDVVSNDTPCVHNYKSRMDSSVPVSGTEQIKKSGRVSNKSVNILPVSTNIKSNK